MFYFCPNYITVAIDVHYNIPPVSDNVSGKRALFGGLRNRIENTWDLQIDDSGAIFVTSNAMH